MTRPLRWITLLALAPLLSLGGCALLGLVAHVVAPQGAFKARYTGLAGQRVAVIAWVDSATEFDYPSFAASDLRSNISRSVVSKLRDQVKAEELKDTVFIDVRQTRLWQKNYPELANRSLTEIAPKLGSAVGATRVVYIELTKFMTRDPKAPILLRGSALVNVRVAEVNGNTARIGYEEVGVEASFPENNSEGVAASESVDEPYVLNGLIDALGWQVASRFFSFSGS